MTSSAHTIDQATAATSTPCQTPAQAAPSPKAGRRPARSPFATKGDGTRFDLNAASRHSRDLPLDLGALQFGLSVNTAGMSLSAVRSASHIAVLAATGLAAMCERGASDDGAPDDDDWTTYELRNALIGIKAVLKLASALHDAAERIRAVRRVARQQKSSARQVHA